MVKRCPVCGGEMTYVQGFGYICTRYSLKHRLP
jgi:hypothetical protein